MRGAEILRRPRHEGHEGVTKTNLCTKDSSCVFAIFVPSWLGRVAYRAGVSRCGGRQILRRPRHEGHEGVTKTNLCTKNLFVRLRDLRAFVVRAGRPSGRRVAMRGAHILRWPRHERHEGVTKTNLCTKNLFVRLRDLRAFVVRAGRL